jgi:hypothetical protein
MNKKYVLPGPEELPDPYAGPTKKFWIRTIPQQRSNKGAANDPELLNALLLIGTSNKSSNFV